MTLLATLFGFEGRINRSTFWLCALAVALLDTALWLVTGNWIRQTYPEAGALAKPGAGVLAVGLPLLIAAVISVWAGLALKVKRLHDRGRSGFWLLAGLIPVLGWLWLFWELALAPGKPKGARFDKGASRADEPAEDDGAGWVAPAALAATAGGLAFATEAAAHADEPPAPQSEVAPESGYGVIAPSEAPVHDANPTELATEAPASTEPYTPAEAAQVTQAQIADYLASVDHEAPAEASVEPVHAPEPEASLEPVLASGHEAFAAPAEEAPAPPAEAHHEAPPEPVHPEAAAEHAAETAAEPAHDDHHPAH